MAELLTMYPGQANSPETTLAGAISASSTSATVLDGSVLPAAPNYLTLGADTTSAETVLMTAKQGNVITITRGQNGTAARAWDKGDTVGRYFTAADHDTLIENINRLNNGKTEKVSSAVAGDFAGLDAGGNLTDSGKKAADFAAASHTHDGKADKVSGATAGDFAGLDAGGNLTDSGKKAADFAAATHTHDGKADKVSNATAGDFAGLDAGGNLTDSGKKAADFAAAAHEHSGYALVKYFQNVTVAASAWVSSSTKPAYPYQAEIPASGVDSSWKPTVTFGDDDAESGNFAQSANTGTNTVIIYAASKPTAQMTILTIECTKGVS